MQTIEDIWKRINLLQSASTTERFLEKQYTNMPETTNKSYDNCYPFMYYLEQGETFYKQAALSPLSIKPILLFYGFVHLIKACLLTVDPFYPGSTSVLAHGVSSRKRKKRQYLFFDDEVKVQKNGICTYFAEQMFHMKHLEGEKYKMEDLLKLVVELDDTFLFIKGKHYMLPLDRTEKQHWIIPKEIPELYYMDEHRFKNYLEEKCAGNISWLKNADHVLTFEKKGIYDPPLRYHLFKHQAFIPNKLHGINNLPDMLIHYLLLYNLSMIARYETEWWFELMKMAPNEDYPFIKAFLDITEKKGPYLIYQYLFRKESPFLLD